MRGVLGKAGGLISVRPFLGLKTKLVLYALRLPEVVPRDIC